MKKDINIDSFNLDEGTIAFWVKANEFDWNNNKAITLFRVSQEEGKIRIIKNEKNVMKGVYQRGEEKSEVSVDVSDLSKQERHHVTFTWSRKDNEIVLYLDNKKNGPKKIS